MINFENLDGFVVDVRTNGDCDTILEDILNEDSDLCDIMKQAPLDIKRAYITEYFTSNYEYVFTKRPHVLLVCEEELYTYDDIESCNKAINTLNKTITELRKLNEEGLQYATSRDNKIEELEDFIGDKAIEILNLEKDLEIKHNTIFFMDDKINKLEDQLETLTQELLKAQQVIEHKDGLLKTFVDKHLKQLDKIKEIINDER